MHTSLLLPATQLQHTLMWGKCFTAACHPEQDVVGALYVVLCTVRALQSLH